MKRVNLVGAYNYEKPLPCEMEDVDICSKMACIKKPRSDIWYSPLKARLVRAGFPVIVNYRSIDRWKLVENQKGKMVLFYRECRMPLPIPVIYVVRYDPKKGYFLKNIVIQHRYGHLSRTAPVRLTNWRIGGPRGPNGLSNPLCLPAPHLE